MIVKNISAQQQSSLLQRVMNSLSSNVQCSSRHDESSDAFALEVAVKSAALPARFVYYETVSSSAQSWVRIHVQHAAWGQRTKSQGRW